MRNHLVFFAVVVFLLAACSPTLSDTVIWIDVPIDGLRLSSLQTINIEGHASSPDGVSLVEIWVNGDLIQTIDSISEEGGAAAFSGSFDPSEYGEYVIQVMAIGTNDEISEPDTSLVIISEAVVLESPTPPDQPTPVPPENGPTPVTPVDPTPVPIVNFWADPEVINAGDCSTLYWEVENVKGVVFGGVEREFSGSYHDCMCTNQSYPLTITFLDDSVEIYYVTINVNGVCTTPTPVDTSPPAAPVQLKPLDGSNLGCLPNAILRWQAPSDPSGISEYRVQVERHSGDFNWQPVSGSTFRNLVDTNFSITVECGYDYRWRVRAVDGNGNVGNWSGWFTFTIPLI